MKPYKNIIFDLGGVILNIDFAKTKDAFVSLGLNEIDSLFGLGHAASYFKEYEIGSISNEKFLEEISKSVSENTDPERIVAAWNAMLLDFPVERIEKLKALKLKYRTFLFSNTNAIHLNAFIQIFNTSFPQENFEDLFEKAYYSHILKARKPDIASYQMILKENGLVAEETIFVDDAEINLKGAREAGMQTFHITEGKTMLDLN